MLPLLQLNEKQAAAVPLLYQLAREHPGITVICPAHSDEPWRAIIDAGTVPGDGRAMSGHTAPGEGPAELLAKLERLFPGTGQDPP